MSNAYAKSLPIDENGTRMVNSPPPVTALASVHRENASTSSVTTLNGNATVVEVTAVGIGAGIRWAANQAASVVTAAASNAMDSFVPAGVTRYFVVPRYQRGDISSVVAKGVQEGLYSGLTGGLATKSAGIGSVLLVQY